MACSSGIARPSALLLLLLLLGHYGGNIAMEYRNVGAYPVPHDFIVDAEVPVDKPVTHACDCSSFDMTMPMANFFGAPGPRSGARRSPATAGARRARSSGA